jgi:hypothetical protein
MLYDNLSSVSQNVLKFYQQLTGEERRIPFIFDDFHFFRSRVIGLDMTIKFNNSGTEKVKIIKYERDPPLFTAKLLIKFQNILRNTTQVIIRHRVKSFGYGNRLDRCGEQGVYLSELCSQ